MRPRVFIARPIQPLIIERIARLCEVEVCPIDAPISPPQFAEQITAMDGLMSVGGNISEAVLITAHKLRIVANVGAGYDTIDLPACTKRGIAVTNTPGVLTESTADFAFTLLLALSRRLFEADSYVREGKWKAGLFKLLWGTELNGKTLGLYGFGQIGQAMARRGSGFGMKVLYYSRHRAAPDVEAEAKSQFVSLKELLCASDFLSLHAPLNSDSQLAIGAEQFALMKTGAFLINTARGKIVHEQALVQALKTGKLAGAGLDVFENEPQICPSLLEMKNVILAPHIASATTETRFRMVSLAADNLLTFFAGQRPPNILNPDVLG